MLRRKIGGRAHPWGPGASILAAVGQSGVTLSTTYRSPARGPNATTSKGIRPGRRTGGRIVEVASEKCVALPRHLALRWRPRRARIERAMALSGRVRERAQRRFTPTRPGRHRRYAPYRAPRIRWLPFCDMSYRAVTNGATPNTGSRTASPRPCAHPTSHGSTAKLAVTWSRCSPRSMRWSATRKRYSPAGSASGRDVS